jgi:hypothetical protein
VTYARKSFAQRFIFPRIQLIKRQLLLVTLVTFARKTMALTFIYPGWQLSDVRFVRITFDNVFRAKNLEKFHRSMPIVYNLEAKMLRLKFKCWNNSKYFSDGLQPNSSQWEYIRNQTYKTPYWELNRMDFIFESAKVVLADLKSIKMSSK